MSFYPRDADKRRASEDTSMEDQEMLDEHDSLTNLPKVHLEQEKRVRREIANSNERRRMQSINSGFQSLKTLIPHHEGEKLSKAAILQQTSEYITTLEQEKTRLLGQNSQLKRMLGDLGRDSDASSHGSPPPKRKKRDTESSDEGIGLSVCEPEELSLEDLKREMIELRGQLDRERRLRMMLEEQTRTLEAQLYPERLRQIASQVQAQMKYQEEKERYLEEKEKRLTGTYQPITQLSQSPPQPKFQASSMSRRNLETIVEAIRHLEGDNVLFDSLGRKSTSPGQKDIPHSDDSEKDSSLSSDQESSDSVVSSSGRDSPINGKNLEVSITNSTITTATATLHLQHGSLFMNPEKYPVSLSSPLLPRRILPAQIVPQRPGVIVHNLS